MISNEPMRPKRWPAWVDWGLLGAWMGVIFYWSNQVHPSVPGIGFDPFRKSLHVLEYMLLFWLWCRAIRVARGGDTLVVAGVALVLTVAYSLSDEVHQHFVGRDGSVRDVLIDGALPAALVAIMWVRRRKVLPAPPDR